MGAAGYECSEERAVTGLLNDQRDERGGVSYMLAYGSPRLARVQLRMRLVRRLRCS